MPYASLKLIPGVNQDMTPALNQAGISTSNLIRFIPDGRGGALTQKLGGWSAYYSQPMTSIVRALWAWEDTSANRYLAVGMAGATGSATLQVLPVPSSSSLPVSSQIKKITPQTTTAASVALSVAATSGSSIFTVTDAADTGITNYDSVYIAAQISVGGTVLFGQYVTDPDGYSGSTTYHVQATNVLGNPVAASTASFTGSISTTNLTVTALASGYIQAGQTITGTGITAGTKILSQTSGTAGGAGVYVVSFSQTVASTAILSNAAAVPYFTTTSGQSPVTVRLPNHGYSAGSTFPVLVPLTVGGVTFSGQYIVQSVSTIDPDTFTINAPTTPTSSASAYLNSGNAYYLYSFGVGSVGASTGYGSDLYGNGAYGGNPITPAYGTPIAATDWTLANWGEVLIASPLNAAASPPYQPIYQWDPLSGSPTATVIPNAPVVNDGIFVAMPERQIIAWGSSFNGVQDPLLIRWCDVNNYNSWIALPTNQAGSYRLPKGSAIVGCIQGPQQALIWTDIGVWSMQYIGTPYVYSFNEVGSGCGLIARKAAGSLNGVVYWMGPSNFYRLSGSGVEPMPCPLWDVIFQNIDTTNLQKIRIAVNSRFSEIAWFYPTLNNGGEINAYVKYNVVLDTWDYGTLSRTAWIDQSVLGPPIGADPSSLLLFQHETSTDANGAALPATLQTGYFAISEGDQKSYVDQVWPDMRWGYFGGTQNATVNLTFYVADYPGDTPVAYGPYPVTQSTEYISPRFRGRLVSIAIANPSGAAGVGSFWRMGNIRYRVNSDGKY